MRSIRESGMHSYVREGAGQQQYSTYTSAPSATTEPVVRQSPKPWNGAAGQYGFGCPSCMGDAAADQLIADEQAAQKAKQWTTAVTLLGLGLGAYLLTALVRKAKKQRRKSRTSVKEYAWAKRIRRQMRSRRRY